MANNSELLAELNAHRVAENLAPFADWRKARHMPLLEAYREAVAAAVASAGDADDVNFEASETELAAQQVRPSVEEAAALFEQDIAEQALLDQDVAELADEPDALILDPATGEMTRESELTDEEAATVTGANLVTTGNAKVASAKELAKTKSYKQVANYDRSSIEKPVAFIHQFLTDNPGMTRKEAVIALTEGYAINYSTARTQYQRWFSKQPKAK